MNTVEELRQLLKNYEHLIKLYTEENRQLQRELFSARLGALLVLVGLIVSNLLRMLL